MPVQFCDLVFLDLHHVRVMNLISSFSLSLILDTSFYAALTICIYNFAKHHKQLDTLVFPEFSLSSQPALLLFPILTQSLPHSSLHPPVTIPDLESMGVVA